jgi:outer membrane protein OmpA-like peptidoglycan-associated protein
MLQNGRADISITRTISGKAASVISGKAAARPRFGRPLLIVPAVIALFATVFAVAPALGQETIFIGGSGQTGVEIDLGALDYRATAPRPVIFGLRHPGDSGANLAPVTLRRPSDTPSSAKPAAPIETAAIEPPKAEMVTKLEPPPAKVPTIVVSPAAEITEPALAPERAAETDPDKMTAEERAAAVARNKNMVSSTSFANEIARGGESGAAPAKAAEKPAQKSSAKAAQKSSAKAAQKSSAKPAQKTEMAALSPADVPTLPGQSMQITFAASESVLPDGAHVPLAAIAATLANDDTLRLQLKAYAGGGADSASHARRLSLSRALAVRSQLIEQGVRSTRIDVRALGNKSESGTSDRVDVILVQR